MDDETKGAKDGLYLGRIIGFCGLALLIWETNAAVGVAVFLMMAGDNMCKHAQRVLNGLKIEQPRKTQ